MAVGRYTIRKAAELLQQNAGERADTMIDKLSKAAFDGALPVHRPGENARLEYADDGIVHKKSDSVPGGISYCVGADWRQCVRDFYEEAYWNDLNKWLEANEPRIYKVWQFPEPATEPTPDAAQPTAAIEPPAVPKVSKPTTHTLVRKRKHALAAVIEAAKRSAVDAADYQSVWAALVSLAEAKNPPPPVLGYIDGEGIKYQTEKGVVFFNRDALRNMMARAAKSAQ